MATFLQRAAQSVKQAVQRSTGAGLGQIGGAVSKITSGRAGESLRSAGGQLTGGIRSFNIVSPARASEPTQTSYGPYPNSGINPPTPSVKGTSTGGGNTTGGSSNSGTTYQEQAGQDTQYNDINNQVDDFGAIIDRDYETTMGALASQEQGLQGQAKTSEENIRAGYAPAKTAIGEEQVVREAGLATEAATAQKQGTSATQQARDLFRQMQQQNIAQLSGLGISSSSVAEALAERLGVETARRLAGITGSVDEVVQNVAKETTRVKTYYQQKVADLEGQMSAGIANIQQSLLDGIRQINSARQQAASDKANRRAELMSRAQTAVAQLQANAQNFAQSLQVWETQRQAALTDARNVVVQRQNTGQVTSAGGAAQSGISGQGLNYQPGPAYTSPGAQVTPGGEDPNLPWWLRT